MTICRECGAPCSKRGASFCRPSCRAAWHNRRKSRGAELYDLVMAMRYDRTGASAANAMTVLSNLARAYHDADAAARGGRPSWDLAEALARLPAGYSTAGDGR